MKLKTNKTFLKMSVSKIKIKKIGIEVEMLTTNRVKLYFLKEGRKRGKEKNRSVNAKLDHQRRHAPHH